MAFIEIYGYNTFTKHEMRPQYLKNKFKNSLLKIRKKINALFPTKKQWSDWSLPSKLTAIGSYLGILMFFIFIFEKATEGAKFNEIEDRIERRLREQNYLFKKKLEMNISLSIPNEDELLESLINDLDDDDPIKKKINFYRNKVEMLGKDIPKYGEKGFFNTKVSLPFHRQLIGNPSLNIQFGNDEEHIGSLDDLSGGLEYRLSILPHGEYYAIYGEYIMEVSNGLYRRSIYEICNKESAAYIDFNMSNKSMINEKEIVVNYIEFWSDNRKLLFEKHEDAENRVIRNGSYNHYAKFSLTYENCWYDKQHNQ